MVGVAGGTVNGAELVQLTGGFETPCTLHGLRTDPGRGPGGGGGISLAQLVQRPTGQLDGMQKHVVRMWGWKGEAKEVCRGLKLAVLPSLLCDSLLLCAMGVTLCCNNHPILILYVQAHLWWGPWVTSSCRR